MDFIWTANLTKIAYMAFVFGLLGFTATLFEKVLGLNVRKDIDAIQKAAKNGNTLPLALLYVGCIALLAIVAQSVLA